MTDHEWCDHYWDGRLITEDIISRNPGKKHSYCVKCGGFDDVVSISCFQQQQINATHDWELKHNFGYGQYYDCKCCGCAVRILIRRANNSAVFCELSCQEAIMKRALK